MPLLQHRDLHILVSAIRICTDFVYVIAAMKTEAPSINDKFKPKRQEINETVEGNGQKIPSFVS